MKDHTLVFLLCVILLSLGRSIHAGECIGSEEEYVAVLEEGPERQGFVYALMCLSSVSLDDGGRWAGPKAANRFALLRADPLRVRIGQRVSSLLKSGWADSSDHRTRLYCLAASRGIAVIDSIDIFLALIAKPDQVGFELYRYLAILQDCRAVDFVADRYQALRVEAAAERSGELHGILNCLYHLPCKHATNVARKLLSRERDPELRARILRILDRGRR